MAPSLLVQALVFLPLVAAQQVGRIPEVHPTLTTETCTTERGCTTHRTSVVLDALSHPIEDIYTGASCENSTGGFNSSICSTAEACARNCALEGVNYAQHGVQTHGDSIALRQYLNITGTETSVSPRLYLLDSRGRDYNLLRLLNQEFTFTVDVSNLPCGMCVY